jgi:hypothetical protein
MQKSHQKKFIAELQGFTHHQPSRIKRIVKFTDKFYSHAKHYIKRHERACARPMRHISRTIPSSPATFEYRKRRAEIRVAGTRTSRNLGPEAAHIWLTANQTETKIHFERQYQRTAD